MRHNQLPSLNAVRYFEAAARHLSFTLAAQELCVTQGAVSRMVQTLEEELGITLFTRNGRFIALTRAGELFHLKAADGLAMIGTAAKAMRDLSNHEALNLIANAGFATRWLVPRLADFQRQHPDVRLQIIGSESDEHTLGSKTHMMVRYGSGNWVGQTATRLPINATLGVVCAPRLARTSGPLRGPADLVGKRLLAYSIGAHDPWHSFFSHFELPEPDLSNSPKFYQLLMLAEAAISGMGFALVPLFLLEPELRAGTLVQAVPQTIASKRGYYITHKKGLERDRKITLFKKWLLATARAADESPPAPHSATAARTPRRKA